jgi:TRAP-type C4-dicarboxylate transport system permease small subunit
LKTALDKLERAGESAETAAIVVIFTAMVLVAVFQIVNRELLGSTFAIPWAHEFARYCVLWLAMVGAIAACRENKHIRIDAISHVVSGTVAAWIRVVVDTFAALVCFAVGWQSWLLVHEQLSWGEFVIGAVPLWLAHALVPLAFFLMAYRFAVRASSLLYDLAKGKVAEEPE